MVEIFPNIEKEIVNQVQGAQRVPYRINPRRNTPRHILIKLMKTKHKERLLKAARQKQQWHTRETPYVYQLIFQQKLCRPEGNGRVYLKHWKGKIYNQDYCTSKDLIQNWWRNQKLFRQAKGKRIQNHQTSFTTNIKRTDIVKKYKRRKTIYKINPKQLRK